VKEATAGRADVAEFLNLSVRRVNQLVVLGVLPRISRGRYSRLAVGCAYIRFLHQYLRREPSPRAQLLARRLALRVERKQLALEQALSKVVSVADHQAALVSMVRTAEAVFGPIGAAVAPQLVGQTSRAQVEAVINAAQREGLSRMARELWRTVQTIAAPAAQPPKAAPVPLKLVPARPRRRRRVKVAA
jgi:hypothetical protein